jgi:hypothetical protein
MLCPDSARTRSPAGRGTTGRHQHAALLVHGAARPVIAGRSQGSTSSVVL